MFIAAIQKLALPGRRALEEAEALTKKEKEEVAFLFKNIV